MRLFRRTLGLALAVLLLAAPWASATWTSSATAPQATGFGVLQPPASVAASRAGATCNVSWPAPASGTVPTAYRVEFSTNAGSSWATAVASVVGLSTSHSPGGTSTLYRVVSLRGAAWQSAASTTATCPAPAPTTLNFGFTATEQTWVVPAGVTSATVETWGAQGGDSNYNGPRPGGLGGYAKGTVTVTPGTTVYVYVGGTSQSHGAAGWNGGGAGYPGDASLWTGGGGGGSDVRVGGNALANRVVVAGGGGGSTTAGYDGGVGGGSSGGDASFACGGTTYGGSQSGGGAGFAGVGSLGQGGGQSGGGGGGGGGFYGGGGGGGSNGACSGTGGGGGGSGYVSGTATTMSSGVRAGHGAVAITYT